MWTRTFTLCTSFALALCLAHTADAQRGGTGALAFGGGGMGGIGSSGLGSSGFGGMGGGMGSSGFGGMGGGMGSSGFGSSGFGGMGGGMGGMGSSGFGNSGMGGGMGNSGFGGAGMGGNNQPGGAQNFVGRGAQQNGQNGMQGSRQMNQFFTNMNKSMSRNNKGQKGKNSSSQNPAQPMRMDVKVAFDARPTNANAVASVIQSRMTKILSDHHMSQPLITVQGDTAVITGDAKSDGERQTIGQLVALESGIRAVRNEMTAPNAQPDAPASPPSADTPSQPGS